MICATNLIRNSTKVSCPVVVLWSESQSITEFWYLKTQIYQHLYYKYSKINFNTLFYFGAKIITLRWSVKKKGSFSDLLQSSNRQTSPSQNSQMWKRIFSKLVNVKRTLHKIQNGLDILCLTTWSSKKKNFFFK